ncbi:helix-turn-helix transcriptional regulator [Nocardia sp. NBC_01327]|uniref:helix-turn-helix transcriptional regulator n=1 Tax=Nocardia sp. NBC_01327 TaxID=2903593 RepID=UPI002E164CC2|nr:helix-turn-helix domain-containing protein [Nocardia sp. NBC_01327]
MEMFPGIENPTDRDRVGLVVAEEQLNLILGLRAIRIQRGLLVSDVAEEMGIDPSQVSRFESGGTNPTFSTVRRYAKAVMGVFHVETRAWEQDQAAVTEGATMVGNLFAPPRHAGQAHGHPTTFVGLNMHVEVAQ